MPADEVAHGADADASRERTGPRHAAPRKPLFTRFHVPAGKAIALAAMPTAVLMGMGFTPTLARADDTTSSKSLTADEYQKCVEALDGSTATPTPSASASTSKSTGTATPSPSTDTAQAKTSSSDSGSGDKAVPAPSASASSSSSSSSTGSSGTSSSGGTSTPSPSASASGGNLLTDLGNAIKDVFTPGGSSSPSASATPSPSPSASATKDTTDISSTVTDTTKKVTDTVKSTVKDATDTATKTVTDATTAASDTVKAAVSASPSPGSTTSTANCPTANTDQGGVENTVALPDAPWHLQASSLLLKGADYQGIVKVRTANGTVKKVLKYVVSDGTDIGDLHQLVDGQKGETYHVQAAKGSTSTIRDGDTVMYTESISGNLFGLIPVTFSPDNPPPLNIPLIYFTKVNVTQAGQFGGTLHVPGMHVFTTGGSS
ncbi:hypothetical protein ACFSL4_31685 [Streptomyces caeni]|uniref:Membrane-bound hydrophilic protein n=1 Tax=Streptomyces caeni TaxID=2307231 RepID=A0ABW4J082_9ACTN